MKKTLLLLMGMSILVSRVSGQEKSVGKHLDLNSRAGEAMQKEDYVIALESYQNLLDMVPHDPELHYSIARLHGLMGDPRKAMDCLEKALILGYDFRAEVDTSLAPVRDLPGFSKIQKRIDDMQKPINTSRVAFTIPQKDLIPEGIAYDAVDDCFYLGSVWKCKIVKVDKQGHAADFTDKKQDGLRVVLGMEVDAQRRVLWAASAVSRQHPDIDPDELGWSGLFKYDLKTGKLIKKYTLHETGIRHLFNDVTVTSQGDVFVTDTYFGAVYVVFHDRDTLELFLKSDAFLYPNGITVGANDHTLYMAASGDGVYRIDIPTRKYRLLSQPDDLSLNGIDGMYFYKGSLVCVQNGLNRISRFFLNRKGDTVERMELIETRNRYFIIPTTGAVAGDVFYYIANSQLRSFNQDGSIFPYEKLKDVVILRTDLNTNTAQDDFSILKGPYLGQKPPGDTPELFAPGIVSTKENAEYGGHFSPDGREFYFTRYSPGHQGSIYFMRYADGTWSKPQKLPFMDDYPGGESCFSPDKPILYFVWYDTSSEAFIHDIYAVEKKGPEWGTPFRLTNTDLGARRISPSVSKNGTLYFSGNYDDPGDKDIYRSRLINGTYTKPENLGKRINSNDYEEHVYVAPDESYIVYDSYRPSPIGKSDLYVSYQQNDGSWSDSQNLGIQVNSEHYDWYPKVTPDGKYLMFARTMPDRSIDIYWVEAKIIEELKPLR